MSDENKVKQLLKHGYTTQQAKETLKRTREESDNHPSTSTKKTTYAKALTTNTLFIMHKEHPIIKLSEDDSSKIIKVLLNKIDEEENIAVKVINTFVDNGRIKIVCADTVTLNWVKEVISTNDVSKCLLVCENMVTSDYITIKISDPNMKPDTLQKRIQRQNDIQTANWRLIKTSFHTDGDIIFFYGIPNESIKKLREIKFRPYVGLGTVFIKVVNDFKGVEDTRLDELKLEENTVKTDDEEMDD